MQDAWTELIGYLIQQFHSEVLPYICRSCNKTTTPWRNNVLGHDAVGSCEFQPRYYSKRAHITNTTKTSTMWAVFMFQKNPFISLWLLTCWNNILRWWLKLQMIFKKQLLFEQCKTEMLQVFFLFLCKSTCLDLPVTLLLVPLDLPIEGQ